MVRLQVILLGLLPFTLQATENQINKLYHSLKAGQLHSLESAYAASLVLEKQDSSKDFCQTLDKLLQQQSPLTATPLETLFYAAKASESQGCKVNKELQNALEQSVLNMINEGYSMSQLFYGVSGVAAAKGKAIKELDDYVKSAFESLCDVSKGVCQQSSEQGLDSFTATGKMLQIAIVGKSAGLSPAILKPISEFASTNAVKIVKTLSESRKAGLGDESYLHALASVIVGVAGLDQAKDISMEAIQRLGEPLMNFLDFGASVESGLVYLSLKTLSGGSSLKQPLFISKTTETVFVDQKVTFQVVVTNAMGQLYGGQCELKISGSGVQDGSMKSKKPGSYGYTFQDVLKLGKYVMEVTASCQNSGDELITSKSLDMLVQGQLNLQNDKVRVVLKTLDDIQKEEELGLNSQLQVIKSLKHDQELIVEADIVFSGSDTLTPHWTMLVLTHLSSRKQVYIPFVEKSATLTSDKVLKQVGALSGKYSVKLYIADYLASNGIDLDVGEIEVLHLPQEDGSQPPTPSPSMYESRHAPKNTISHIMRPPDQRPPAVISLVFACVVLVPVIFVVLVGMPIVGANFKGFPKHVASQTTMFVFHGVLGAILLLYLYYWLFMYSILDLIPYLAFAGVVGAVTTSKALTIMSDQRDQMRAKNE